MGTTPAEHFSEGVITHSICLECADKLYAELGIKLPIFIDGLDAPVVVVNSDGIVQTANKQAKSFLQKELAQIEGYRGGEVFQCAYARLPEGCGNTVHCSGCTIRRAVMETYQTGKSQHKRPAYLNRGTPESHRKMELLISTEKVNEVVLLRIDRVIGDSPD